MNNLKKLGFLAVAGVLSMTACKKEYIYTNTDTNSDLQAVYNRTVNYTVVVTSQRESGFRGEAGVQGATVAVAVGGEIKTATTDANGLAVFTGLVAGNAAVTVSAGNHTTASFIVDLSANTVGSNSSDIDNHSERSAATMVTLLPTGALGTATLRGRLDAERDFTSTGEETVPDDAGATLVARVDFNNFNNGPSANSGALGYTHSGDGRVVQFYYEGLAGTTTQALNNNTSRTYTMTLPATAYGLDVEVLANPYIANLVVSASTTESRTFSTNSTTNAHRFFNEPVYTGQVYVRNLRYNAL